MTRNIGILLILVIAFTAAISANAQVVVDSFFLTVDDGVRLDCTLFMPDTSIIPSLQDSLPAIIFVHGLGGSKKLKEPIARAYAELGYVTFCYSVRGQGNSEGLSTVFSTREQRDLEFIVDSIAGMTIVNDTLIGISGGSQGGYHCWFAAVNGMNVRAVAPENSVPIRVDAAARYGCYSSAITSEINYSERVRLDTLAYPLKKWLREDNYDSVRAVINRGRFFDSSDVEASSANYLMMGAWHDHIFPHNRVPGAFAVAPHNPIMYLGVGGHGSGLDSIEQSFRNELLQGFFAEHLNGENHSLDTMGPVVISLGPEWRHINLDSWPPDELIYRTYYLRTNGSLSEIPPGVSDSSFHIEHNLLFPSYTWEDAVEDEFLFSPFAFRKDKRIWRTPPFTDSIIVVGIPKVEVHAKGPLPKFQINLQLYDEGPEDTTYLSQISLGKMGNTDSTAWDLLRGEMTIIGWEIAPEHRLRIDWTSINYTLDSTLWTIPYWDAYGILTLGLDGTHTTSISISQYTPTGIFESQSNRPDGFRLIIHPNPFNSTVGISLKATHTLPKCLNIYDICGRLVEELPVLLEGEVAWKPDESLGSGIYFIRVKVEEISVTRSVVYLK
ncbi:alpha/beta fold hydrolase [candidate division WOR-3 bacterium]|nr:alpha/beta fold hydrolase [candidate division WOR-3 bacterium]